MFNKHLLKHLFQCLISFCPLLRLQARLRSPPTPLKHHRLSPHGSPPWVESDHKVTFKLTQSHQKHQEMFQTATQVRPGFSSARKHRKNATVPPAGSLKQDLEKPSHRAGCTTAPLLQRSDGTVLPLSLADPAPSTQHYIASHHGASAAALSVLPGRKEASSSITRLLQASTTTHLLQTRISRTELCRCMQKQLSRLPGKAELRDSTHQNTEAGIHLMLCPTSCRIMAPAHTACCCRGGAEERGPEATAPSEGSALVTETSWNTNLQ